MQRAWCSTAPAELTFARRLRMWDKKLDGRQGLSYALLFQPHCPL
jgi:hypothetical protein